MGFRKSLLIAVAAALILSCFFPWVSIPGRNIVVGGMDSGGTTFGKPGLLSLVFAGLIVIFSLVPRIWAHRICIFSGAINCGWALRNFIILPACQGGECPERQPAFYVYVISSLLLLVAILLQDVKMKAEQLPDGNQPLR